MGHPATWKIVTLGAALTGLGVAGAGTAHAHSGPTPGVQPLSVTAASAAFSTDVSFDSPFDLDDVIRLPYDVAHHVGWPLNGMYDTSWDTWYDD